MKRALLVWRTSPGVQVLGLDADRHHDRGVADLGDLGLDAQQLADVRGLAELDVFDARGDDLAADVAHRGDPRRLVAQAQDHAAVDRAAGVGVRGLHALEDGQRHARRERPRRRGRRGNRAKRRRGGDATDLLARYSRQVIPSGMSGGST